MRPAARVTLLALLLGLALAWSQLAFAEVAVPPLTGRVVDQTATLGSEVATRLEQKLQAFEARKGSQIAVLIVPTTQPEAIEQYSLRVAEAWKIGRNKIDDGAILLVAKNDRRLRIEVGYGLEGALTDVTAKRIIDEVITPKFKTGDFAGGIEDGVDKIIGVIDGEALPAPKPQRDWGEGAFNPEDLFNPVLIIAALALSGLMRALLGRLPGAAATGGLVGLIAWFVAASWITAALAALLAFLFALFGDALTSGGGGGFGGGRSRGGWSGGSSGGSSDSGWSGGGGSFGGGGASGRW